MLHIVENFAVTQTHSNLHRLIGRKFLLEGLTQSEARQKGESSYMLRQFVNICWFGVTRKLVFTNFCHIGIYGTIFKIQNKLRSKICYVYIRCLGTGKE